MIAVWGKTANASTNGSNLYVAQLAYFNFWLRNLYKSNNVTYLILHNMLWRFQTVLRYRCDDE